MRYVVLGVVELLRRRMPKMLDRTVLREGWSAKEQGYVKISLYVNRDK